MTACVLRVLVLFELVSRALGSNNTHFANITGISGKVCPSSDVVLSVSAPSLISCVYYCTTFDTCRGVFYNDEDLSCIGCQGYYNVSSGLDDKTGTVYFSSSQNVPMCLGPLPNVTNVNVSQFTGDRKIGASFPYTCDPACALFPLPGNSNIVCKDDETWSTPKCWGVPVGANCTGLACLNDNARCINKTANELYCHCEFGFEFDDTLGTCVKVCNLYSHDPIDFVKVPNKKVDDYRMGNNTNVSELKECVNFCYETHPTFLSFLFNSYTCSCRRVSEQQFIKAHGELKDTNAKSFYDRPCVTPA